MGKFAAAALKQSAIISTQMLAQIPRGEGLPGLRVSGGAEPRFDGLSYYKPTGMLAALMDSRNLGLYKSHAMSEYGEARAGIKGLAEKFILVRAGRGTKRNHEIKLSRAEES